MSYCISDSSPVLSDFVKHYWTLDNCVNPEPEYIQRIVPNGLQELIFYLDSIPESLNKNFMLNEFTVLTGQLSSFYDLKIKGRLSLFSIVFKPYGLSVFFDIPVREIFNQNVPLKFLVKDKTNELEERLSKALSFEDRKSIAEQFLFERLTKSKTKYHFDRIKESVGIINNSKGTVNIEKLANVACFSRKQFERTFLDYVGISPKKFMRIVRFQHSIFTKSKNANISLTDLTYCSGYYDQSHMTNNFLKLTGMGPKQYFKECEPFSDYFH